MLPHSPPIVQAAHFNDVTKILTLEYDRTLRTGGLSNGNVRDRFLNVRRSNVAPSTILGTTVTATMANPGVDIGPDVADYLATPPEIFSRQGAPAAAFANFPIT